MQGHREYGEFHFIPACHAQDKKWSAKCYEYQGNGS